MERRIIIAFLISMIFLSFYNAFVIKPKLKQQNANRVSVTNSATSNKAVKMNASSEQTNFLTQQLDKLKFTISHLRKLKTRSGWVAISDKGIVSVYQKVPLAAVPVDLKFKFPVFMPVKANHENCTFDVKQTEGNIVIASVLFPNSKSWIVGPQLPHIKGLPARYARYYEGVILVGDNGKVKRIPSYKFKNSVVGSFKGIGVYSKYYIAYISFASPIIESVKMVPVGDSIVLLFKVNSGNHKVIAKFYAGLARKEYLKNLPEANYILKRSWLSGITHLLWWVLKLCYKVSHNWGVAIILLAILFSLVFMPLTLKSYSAMKKMQQIQPQLKSLQERYKDDPQKLNQEVLMLYAKYGVNPFSGCLPLFIQLPVFFSLYPLLLNTYEFKNATFLWIKDLSRPDAAFHIGDFQVNILPLIVVILMSLQQKISMAKAGNQQNQAMLFIFPFIFLLIFYNMPSGLVLFWLVLSAINFGQQYYFAKVL